MACNSSRVTGSGRFNLPVEFVGVVPAPSYDLLVGRFGCG